MSTPITVDTSQSPNQMSWYVSNRVLQFTIAGVYTPEMATSVNENLLVLLDKAESPITVIINCSDMKRPANFEEIRQEQTFMHHPMLAHIYIVSKERLVRFAMMVIFNHSPASVRLFDSLEQTMMMVDTRNVRRG